MADREMAERLLALLGGAGNVASSATCMTRLRVSVRDVSAVDAEGIRGVDGVLGLVEGQTMQVVLGPGKANKVAREFAELVASGGLVAGVACDAELTAGAAPDAGLASVAAPDASCLDNGEAANRAAEGLADGGAAEPAAEGLPVECSVNNAAEGSATERAACFAGVPAEKDAAQVTSAGKSSRKMAYAGNPVQAFLKKIANVFVPLLPGIIAAGLINGVCNVVNVSTGNAFAGEWWYQGIRSMGWALFAYLPVVVGYNAAREFGGTEVLGGIAGMMCIFNVAMPLLASGSADPSSAILLPITGAAYNPSAGGMVAALIAGAFFAWLERQLHKVMPGVLDTFLTPLLVLIIGAFALMLVIQLLCAQLSSAVFMVLQLIYEKLGVLGGYILAAGFLPLVSVGLHQVLTPIHALLNDPSGATAGVNYLLPILMMAGGGQVGAGIALYLKTKNARLRDYIAQSLPAGVLGVGEPLMYAVTLPLVRPFVTACLGAGFGGALISLFHVGAVSQGVSGLCGLLIMVPGTQLQFLAGLLVAYAGGFVLTWFFGVDEQRINELYGDE